MPSTVERINPNLYRIHGENEHLHLAAYEVAWSGAKTLTLGQVIGRVVVLAVLAGFVAVLVSAVRT